MRLGGPGPRSKCHSLENELQVTRLLFPMPKGNAHTNMLSRFSEPWPDQVSFVLFWCSKVCYKLKLQSPSVVSRASF
jgi:hypothetical protein